MFVLGCAQNDAKAVEKAKEAEKKESLAPPQAKESEKSTKEAPRKTEVKPEKKEAQVNHAKDQGDKNAEKPIVKPTEKPQKTETAAKDPKAALAERLETVSTILTDLLPLSCPATFSTSISSSCSSTSSLYFYSHPCGSFLVF